MRLAQRSSRARDFIPRNLQQARTVFHRAGFFIEHWPVLVHAVSNEIEQVFVRNLSSWVIRNCMVLLMYWETSPA